MKLELAKWGNSYALRIPKKIVEEYDLLEGVILEREATGIFLKPSQKQQLQDLVKNIKPHKEIEWGPRRGREVW